MGFFSGITSGIKSSLGAVNDMTNKVIGSTPISQGVTSLTGLSPQGQRNVTGAALLGGAAMGVGGGAAATPLPAGGMTATGTLGADAAMLGSVPAGGMTATGTLSAADASLMGVGGAGSAGASVGGANSLSALLSGGGSASQYGSLLGGGAALLGQYQQGEAAKDAAAQAQALNKPWYDTGLGALDRLNQGVSAYQESPYTKYLQESGNQAINRSAAAKGMLNSGNVLAALADYGQQTAGRGYNDWWNQQATLAGYGSNARDSMTNANTFGTMGKAASNASMLQTGGNLLANLW